jgi:DNA-directed RNA polymerase specialized sigma24 family protein
VRNDPILSSRNPQADPSEAVELLEALKDLPPKQRAALVLHYYGGYRAREIALIVGSTAAAVRQLILASQRVPHPV